MPAEAPRLISGDLAVDDRGSVSFVNGFSFGDVARFYRVQNHSTTTIRAWHGHKIEGKYVDVVSGSAIVAAIRFDENSTPGEQQVHRYVLSAAKPAVLYIPPGFANGFRPLEKDTILLFFSTSTLEQSKGDDYRFPADHWGAHIWEVENR